MSIHMKPGRALALATFVGLSACNASPPPPVYVAPPPPASTNVTPSSFRMPEGAGCSGDVARWRAIQDNDLQMGHVNRSVYDQIQGEIGEAAAACEAGRGAQASAMVRASKARHGYPG